VDNELKVYHTRRNSLTPEDLEDITAIFESIQHKKHSVEDCRFSSITPEELRVIIEGNKKFNAIMDDSKSIIRRFFTVLILSGLSGIIIAGVWSKFSASVKRVIVGE